MKRRTRLLISIVAGLAAAAIALVYATSVQSEASRAQAETFERYGGDLVKVCVAMRDIEPGETLDESSVRIEKWVASLIPDDAVRSIKGAAGKKATSRIPKNAVISSLYFQKSENSISAPKGKTVLTVASDDAHALGGALKGGDSVDVYVSKDGVAHRLCEASIVSTSTSENESRDSELAWVTLAVDPDHVEELLAATARGEISLTMPGVARDAKQKERA